MKRCLPVLLSLLCLLAACSNLMFYPYKNWVQTPDEKGYDYQNIAIPTEDDDYLNAWLLPQRDASRQQPLGAVIYFHGNSENISTHIASVYWLTDAGYDLLLVDYRGFGHSDGDKGLENSLADIRLSLSWFNQRYHGDIPKYLIGQSIGASMAGYVVATEPVLRQPLSAVVLDSGFADYRRITRDVLGRFWLTWLFQYPVSWGMPGRYDLLDHVAEIAPTPLLIVHGTKDRLVTYDHAETLFAAAGEPKTLLSFDGPHIAAFNDVKNREALLAFFAAHR